MKHTFLYTLSLLLFTAASIATQAQSFSDEKVKTLLKQDIEYLSSDKLTGRLTGTKGAKLASKYISKELASLKIKPLIGRKFIQKFTYQTDDSKTIKATNVVGYIDNGADKTILIGAHYDHIGKAERHTSSDPNGKGQIHPGANENASGVALALLLARKIAQKEYTEKANYIIALYSGHEDGLQGSKALAKYIADNKIKLDLVVNLDKLGTLDEMGNMSVSGTKTASNIAQVILDNTSIALILRNNPNVIVSADHHSFYKLGYPSLSFSNAKLLYQTKPNDTADKVSYDGLSNVYGFLVNLLGALEREKGFPFTLSE